MLKNFKEELSFLEGTDEFKNFRETHKNYYLAHGFAQLDKDLEPTKNWQIGYYSKENDHLAVFDLSELGEPKFDEAFKEGGIIDELKIDQIKINTDFAIKKAKKLLEEKYPAELILSVLVIIQAINKEPSYNLTFITQAFSMITIQLNAETGDVVKESKSSVMDLKKQ